MINYTLKIAELRKETSDAVTIIFKQPGLKKIKYKAGQYISLIFKINGRRYVRPYSFSSAPGVDKNLEVTVKRVSEGAVSNHILDKINIDDLVEVIEPMGDFVLSDSFCNSSDQRDLILWGAGSGITPLFSILKYVLANYESKVTLVYGNRNHETIIFHEQLNVLKEVYSDRFFIHHFHTQPTHRPNDSNFINGRINAKKVVDIIKNDNEVKNSFHYICGPSDLKLSIKKVLADLQVSPDDIYSEDFELVKCEKDFEDIVARTVKIVYNSKSFEVEVTKGKSILEAGLDALIEMPYSCQTGNCSVCKGKLVNGVVKQIGPEKSKHALEHDEYLLCCAYPLLDSVEIHI